MTTTINHDTKHIFCLFSLFPGMLDTGSQRVAGKERKILSSASLKFISRVHHVNTMTTLPFSTHATLCKLSLFVYLSCHQSNVCITAIPFLKIHLILSFHTLSEMACEHSYPGMFPTFGGSNCFSFSEIGVWT